MEWFHMTKFRLVGRKQFQTFVGQFTFRSRFISFGPSMVNSSYAALSNARHLHFRRYEAIFSTELASDVAMLAKEIPLERWTPIV